MNQAFSDYERLKAEGGTFLLDDYSVIEFDGSEWREWLQGQITNDVRLLTEENPISFSVCKPTGQMIAPGDLHLAGDKGWMVVPLACAPRVLERVNQMVILEDCTAHIIERTALVHVIPGSEGMPSIRTLYAGHDMFGDQDGEFLSPDAFRLATLEAGTPLWGDDMDESNFPAEMGAEYEARVMSYTKGCYTGQEINHRLHSRGHTNKTWGVYVSEHPHESGADFVDMEGTKIGTITRVCEHPEHGFLVGAFAKNGSVPGMPQFKP